MTFAPELLPECGFLAGPTASGKSATSLVLAELLNAEIVSLDSMAIYRHMDIGTAKPGTEDRQRVPHHMIDIAEPHEEFSVSEFLTLAEQCARDILNRNRMPVFAGGTGLYLRAVLRGLSAGPPADWSVRQRWEQLAITNGPEWLHRQLQSVDPVAAGRLHANDMRRIIRALEVHELTGQPISDGQSHSPRPQHLRPRFAVWLEPPREWLRQRIDQRVDQMMNSGWLEETRLLMSLDPPPGRTASQALGYRELMECLRTGSSIEAAVEQIRTATRQFAKRQHTWFRSLEECQALSISGNETAHDLALSIAALATQNRIASPE